MEIIIFASLILNEIRAFNHQTNHQLMLKFSRILSFVSAIAFSAILSAQTPLQDVTPIQEIIPISTQAYDGLKAQGSLNPNARYLFTDAASTIAVTPPTKTKRSSRAELTSPPCGYVPTNDFLDPWGGEVYFDDAPPAGDFEVQIPFDFCFYGSTYNSFFINNNGNITFEEAYATFTAQAFPAAGIPAMIAPFWGDVDTGSEFNPLGQVRYNVYPEYAIISWDTVAVYPENGSLRNTFQLIISNGTSTVLPPGTNIGFIYADMQWTTGDASGGTGGFGGTPATVGVNRGDGIDYIQLGRFDAPGTNYDGPFGDVDQVSFLDNTVYFFNTCLEPGAENNIAPLAIGAPLCDTITICVGEEYLLDFTFIPVEPDQIVNDVVASDNVPGFTFLGVETGYLANVFGVFVGDETNLGLNTITFTASDNGNTPASYTINLVFNVVNLEAPQPVILGEDTVCLPTLSQLTTSETYPIYQWSNSSTQNSIQVGTGVYTVTVFAENGCRGTSPPFQVTSFPLVTPVIVGDNHTCFSETAQLATIAEYASYQWSNNTSDSLAIVTAGSYTVTVEDTNGCVGTSQPFVVGNSTPTPFIDGFERFCKFDTIQLFVNDTFDSYRWLYLTDTLSTADTLTWTGGTPDNDDVIVIVTDEFGCTGVDTLNAPYTELPTAIFAYDPNPSAILINTPITFTNTSTPGAGDTIATWFWVFNNPPAGEDTVYIPSPTESFPDTGLVDVTIVVTTEVGCKDTLTVPIQIIDKPFVPNVFSPNGDGKNDLFVIPFLYGYPENTVVVYSRWGKVVYEATNYNSDWNGDNVISGTYFYVVSAPTLSEPLKGTVTIIKE